MAVSYTLDAADRLQSLLDSSTNSSTSYTYVPDSRLGGVSNFNGTSTAYTWDNARRLQQILHQDGGQTLSQHTFTLDALGNRTHFSEQLPQIAGLAPSVADIAVAQQLPESSNDTTLDDLVAATTDAAQPLTAGVAAPPTIPVGPPTGARPNAELPLEDSSTRPERPALFHAEPTGHTLEVFDKTSPTASVQVQHAWTRASLRLELPGVASHRSTIGNTATAQVGDLSVTWTSFDDHLKEDLVLAKQPASNTISFKVQMHGLAFANDGQGGWVLQDAGGLPRFHLPAPTVKDALGRSGTATLDLTLTQATISIDPAFLASAAYPVTVDPTINYTLQSSGTDFTYDSYAPVSELKTVTANQAPNSTSSYTFDTVRNRTQRVQGPTGSQVTTTYTYDRADRILTAGAVTYTVDANGNLKARTGGAINDSFSYDQANRLTSATTGSGSGTYTYDGDGKRTSKTVGGTTTSYVWDVAGGLPRLLSDGTHKFVWGANGLAYNLTLGASPTVETYHADQIGSIREITNSDGSVRTTYLTDEYGNRTTVRGTDDQPFQFTGEQVDPETGFVYLRTRYYEPQTGRFLSRDPAPIRLLEPFTTNKYVYVANNPINYVDPSGADPATSDDDSSSTPVLVLPQVPRSCDEIARDIQGCVDELNKRIRDYEADQLLLRFGPTETRFGLTSLETHDVQFSGWQNRLNRLLIEWDRTGCGAPNGRFSTEAYALKDMAPPRYVGPAYDPSGWPEAIAAGGVVAYLAYRVARLVLSAPVPPTVVPNLLLP